MGAARTLTVRRPRLAFPARLDPLLLEGQPEVSYALVGLSLFLPYLEPYLIRTMNHAKHRVTDRALVEAIALFNGQEGQHSRQHARFNDAVRGELPALAPLEQELARDYHHFDAARSLQWNLAYAERFEAFTSALACFLFEDGMLRDARPAAARELFEWHIVEELEHRCVAFDVYEHLYGGTAYRLAVGLFVQRHLCRFVVRAARVMFERDAAAGRTHAGTAWQRLQPFLARAARRLLPAVARTYGPRYTPHRIAMPAGAEAVLRRFG